MDMTILLIDDEMRILRTFSRSLRLAGYTVFTAESGEDGLALYHQERPDIILLDLRMPGIDGLAVLQAIREHDPEANVILCTGHGDKDAVIEALRAGASDFLAKPIDQVTLESALRRAEERIHLKRELRASQEALRQHNLRLEEEVKARTAELEREIEERKRTEKALRESEARERARATDLETIMDAVPAVIWIARDPEGHDIVGNPASYRLLRMDEGSNTSLTPEEGLAPWHFSLFFDGAEKSPEELPMQMATKHGVETRDHEGEIVFDDGTRRTIFGSTVPLRDEEGHIRGAVAAYVDITEQKRIENQLRFQAQLLDAVGKAVIATDLSGHIIYWNRAAEDTYGWSRDEVMGRNILSITPVPERVEQARGILDQLRAGESWSGEFVVQCRDGSRFPAIVTDFPLHDEDGNLIGIVGVTTNIADFKEDDSEETDKASDID